jgi:hypothetical protein
MQDLKEVIIKGIDIPFIDLVILLVKLALAAIPAMFIILSTFFVFNTILFGF